MKTENFNEAATATLGGTERERETERAGISPSSKWLPRIQLLPILFSCSLSLSRSFPLPVFLSYSLYLFFIRFRIYAILFRCRCRCRRCLSVFISMIWECSHVYPHYQIPPSLPPHLMAAMNRRVPLDAFIKCKVFTISCRLAYIFIHFIC